MKTHQSNSLSLSFVSTWKNIAAVVQPPACLTFYTSELVERDRARRRKRKKTISGSFKPIDCHSNIMSFSTAIATLLPFFFLFQMICMYWTGNEAPMATRFVRFPLGAGADQRRLLKFLFDESKHDPLERPVKNDSDTLPVKMSLALQQIIDFVCSSPIARSSSVFNFDLGWEKRNSENQRLARSRPLFIAIRFQFDSRCSSLRSGTITV